MTNTPDRMDSWRVPDGIPAIAATKDEKVNNAYSYKFARQDHTLGNLLRMELLRDPRVKFVGYKHPHPLENDILLRIQTAQGTAPTQALSAAAKRLEDEFRLVSSKFSDEVKRMEAEQQELNG